ncbi:ATP-binding cassette domain-containing protein [bacterium]|nr:MAG: ATP-binding cassette domain-containing protein [bacterium]
MLSVVDLTVRYTNQAAPALQGICLNVAGGERVAVVGPSGGGKTTLFRAVNGSVPVQGGYVALEGERVGEARGVELRALRRRIAVIAQMHDLVDRLDVYQNVMAGALGRWSSLHALRFLLRPSGAELVEARTALERVGIPEKLRSRTSDLSGGQRQRVAIARALVQRPAVLLADEPVASLDPARSEQILALLCDLARERGLALICSLHQPELALRYFDRIVGLRHGRMVFDRPVAKIEPEHLVFAS